MFNPWTTTFNLYTRDSYRNVTITAYRILHYYTLLLYIYTSLLLRFTSPNGAKFSRDYFTNSWKSGIDFIGFGVHWIPSSKQERRYPVYRISLRNISLRHREKVYRERLNNFLCAFSKRSSGCPTESQFF